MLTVVGLASCSGDNPIISETEDQNEEPVKPATVYEPMILSVTQEKTCAEAEIFASKFLLSVINEEKDATQNVMVSPLGVEMLLGMLSNGMDDIALTELKEVLGSGKEELNEYYSFISKKLPVADNQVEFNMANSFWIANGIKIEDQFSNILETRFEAEKFYRALPTEETRKEINGWCSEKTKGWIPEFLEKTLDQQCLMFIVNAWYFNGKWQNPFDTKNTVEGMFSSSDGKNQSVEMMNAEFKAYYSKLQDGGQIVSLPYGNGTFQFNIYLPAAGQDLLEGLKKNIYSLSGGDYHAECELCIPKFDLEYKNERIFDILSEMGIRSISEEGHLDGVFKDALVNFIQQSTALELTEDGATAAAVTGGGLAMFDPDFEPSGPVKIIVDRPFAFSITENWNKITLMSGIIRNLE